MYHNTAVIKNTLERLQKVLKDAEYLQGQVEAKIFTGLEQYIESMIKVLKLSRKIGVKIKEEEKFINTPSCCINAIFSLENIRDLVQKKEQLALDQIKFELIPILEDLIYDFYFFTSVFGERQKEKWHYENEFSKMVSNRYINAAVKKGQYKYDVSLVVSAYNHLDYTKRCIDHIIRYTPNDLNYELILINNGSEDDTQKYFESLRDKISKPIKIIWMKENVLNSYIAIRSRACEGRYLLDISNDVLVMTNYVTNLMRCMTSDKKIAMIVASTPGVGIKSQCVADSNLTPEEGEEFAKKNNISDPSRWESRNLLYNPIALYNSEILLAESGIGFWDKYFVYTSGGDDALSRRLIEAGYKLILAKDCYCYHFGKVTRAKDTHTAESVALLKRRFS